MSNQSNSDQKRCTDDEAGGQFHPPEAHDLIEVNQDLLLDLDSSAVYRIESECRRDGCQERFFGVRAVGRTIETVQDYRVIAHEVYESHYDEQRQTAYRVFRALTRDLPRSMQYAVANHLGNAAMLGRLDAKADRVKRTEQEVFDELLAEHLEV